MMHHSSGIIPYKFENGEIKFFLGHPGGPMNTKKNYWALLKGGMEKGEDEIEAAIREFQEESGIRFNKEEVRKKIWLVGTVKQRKDKLVTAFALEVDDIDATKCFSNIVDGEDFPEIDKYDWFNMSDVRSFSSKSNIWFYEEILRKLGINENN